MLMRIYGVLTTLVVVFSLAVSLPAYGQGYYLDIPGGSNGPRPIPGDVTIDGYVDQICVKSFSWDVQTLVSASGGGGGPLVSGARIAEEFQFGKSMDIASPLLFGAVTGGQTYPLVTLNVVLITGDGVKKVATYELRGVIFSGLQPGGRNGFGAEEVISLRAEQVKISYFDLGSNGNEVLTTYEYNFRTNVGG